MLISRTTLAKAMPQAANQRDSAQRQLVIDNLSDKSSTAKKKKILKTSAENQSAVVGVTNKKKEKNKKKDATENEKDKEF